MLEIYCVLGNRSKFVFNQNNRRGERILINKKKKTKKIAVKKIINEDPQLLRREIVLLSMLSSPYIIDFLGSCRIKEGDELICHLVTNFADNGNLFDLFGKWEIDPEFKINVLLDVSKGIQYLHSKNVVHR